MSTELTRDLVENGLSSIYTTLHVSTEHFVTWLCWESLELYLHSPTWIHWTSNHVAMLRMCGALPPLPYICPLNFLSRGWFEKLWSSTSTTLHESTELITWLGWDWWCCTSTPLHVSTEVFITWLFWEWMELYPHFPTCVHWTFYYVAGLRTCGDPHPLPACVHWNLNHVALLRKGGAPPPFPCMRPLKF